MASKKATKTPKKTAPKAAKIAITLGPPERNDLAPSSPNDLTPPLPSHDDESSEDSSPKVDNKKTKVRWSSEMDEALIEHILGIWIDGGKSDNSFKKEVFQAATVKVNRVVRGRNILIRWEQCKNKWGDYKEKWKHWAILSQMSGFG
jgi:Myb/SANT-like DNA-binding protein